MGLRCYCLQTIGLTSFPRCSLVNPRERYKLVLAHSYPPGFERESCRPTFQPGQNRTEYRMSAVPFIVRSNEHG